MLDHTPMNTTEFSKILLVQALEESDPHGRHLPLSTRHHATQQARDQHRPSPDHSSEGNLPFLIKRTEIMWAFVNKAFPALAPSWNRLAGGHSHCPGGNPCPGSRITHQRPWRIATGKLTQFPPSPFASMEFWNLSVHRIHAITEILLEDNLVRHCSQLVIQNDRNLGTTSLALSEPFRSFDRPLGTGSHETVHGTLVASRATRMDSTPSPTPPPRSSLYGLGHRARSVYPRVGSRLPSYLGKHVSLCKPGPGPPPHPFGSCRMAPSLSLPRTIGNPEPPSPAAWSRRSMDSYVGCDRPCRDRNPAQHHGVDVSTIPESGQGNIRITPARSLFCPSVSSRPRTRGARGHYALQLSPIPGGQTFSGPRISGPLWKPGHYPMATGHALWSGNPNLA